MKSWSAIREAEISNIASVLDGGVPRGTEEYAVADIEFGDRGCRRGMHTSSNDPEELPLRSYSAGCIHALWSSS